MSILMIYICLVFLLVKEKKQVIFDSQDSVNCFLSDKKAVTLYRYEKAQSKKYNGCAP